MDAKTTPEAPPHADHHREKPPLVVRFAWTALAVLLTAVLMPAAISLAGTGTLGAYTVVDALTGAPPREVAEDGGEDSGRSAGAAAERGRAKAAPLAGLPPELLADDEILLPADVVDELRDAKSRAGDEGEAEPRSGERGLAHAPGAARDEREPAEDAEPAPGASGGDGAAA
ncbi:MAG TPA: hypothetical protein VN213_06860, partial [Solirubrobacteraceae bacterium]|nr:hypothetical protein [Solirubrobacteraceae bacterium]